MTRWENEQAILRRLQKLDEGTEVEVIVRGYVKHLQQTDSRGNKSGPVEPVVAYQAYPDGEDTLPTFAIWSMREAIPIGSMWFRKVSLNRGLTQISHILRYTDNGWEQINAEGSWIPYTYLDSDFMADHSSGSIHQLKPKD